MKINQMKRDELFEGFYLIKSVGLRKTRADKDYIAPIFQDDAGEISGNLWNVQPCNVEEFVTGKVVYMKGRCEVYNGTPQVSQITPRNSREGEPSDPNDFREKSPVDAVDVRDYFEQMIFRIENAVWQRVARAFYRKYGKKFFTYPAAKTNHHAPGSGLAYHTITMVRLADAIGDIYPQLSKSLLYAGIMLHDLVKVIELISPGNTEHTVRSNLAGHIVLIDEEIIRVLTELNIDGTKENAIILCHVILSHHGSLEYDNPARLRVMEAEIIRIIDNIDAEIMMMTTALSRIDEGEMTNRVFAMGSRSFYKPEL